MPDSDPAVAVGALSRLRQAERDADEATRLLATIEALAHIGHFRVKGSHWQWSDEIYRIHGYQPGEIVPSQEIVVAALHPEDRPEIVSQIARALADQRDVTLQARLIRGNGEERHVQVRGSSQRDDAGFTLVGTMIDITEQVRTETQIRDNIADLHLALDAGRMCTWDYDFDSGAIRRSGNTGTVLGWSDGDIENFYSSVHPEDRDRVRDVTDTAVLNATPYAAEFRWLDNDGSVRWVCEVGRCDSREGRARLVGVSFDITDRKLAEHTLRESEERLALALKSGNDGLWDWNLAKDIYWCSDRWHTMLGYEPGSFEGRSRSWEELIHPDDKAEVMRRTADHLEGRSPDYECEMRLRTKDRGYSWVLSRGRVVTRDDAGRALRILGTHIDISARKQVEAQLAHLARHDALTNLPNRAFFRHLLADRLAEVTRREVSLAVMCLDLDRFKAVNDTLGHAAGDCLLQQVAERLRGACSVGTTVARLGGDEFAILMPVDGRASHQVGETAAAIIAAMEEPVAIDGMTASIGVSIGIALAPEHGMIAEDLFKRADLALYRAKGDGRSVFRIFEPGMDDDIEERRRLELMLRGALARGEFVLHYQPVISAVTERISGFEALLRWTHPGRGRILPAEFIPLAEETGLIVPIGRWVLQTACAEAARWSDDIKIAVNISAVQFKRGSLVEDVLAALAGSGLAPARLELEVTESILLEKDDNLRRTLHALQSLGVGIVLDDFGTGYSSLSYLCRFPFNRIKIDRSFVAGLSDPNSAAIVRAVIDLGRQLNMPVTAEGVETDDQRLFLCEAGCSDLQGFLFSPGQVAAELPAMLVRKTIRAAA